MLTAFPHLFPPQTQPSADAPFPTAAAPALWKEFEDFYGRAMSPSQRFSTTSYRIRRRLLKV